MEIERNTYYTFENFVSIVFSSYRYKKPSKDKVDEAHTITRLGDFISFWEADYTDFSKLQDRYKFVRIDNRWCICTKDSHNFNLVLNSSYIGNFSSQHPFRLKEFLIKHSDDFDRSICEDLDQRRIKINDREELFLFNVVDHLQQLSTVTHFNHYTFLGDQLLYEIYSALERIPKKQNDYAKVIFGKYYKVILNWFFQADIPFPINSSILIWPCGHCLQTLTEVQFQNQKTPLCFFIAGENEGRTTHHREQFYKESIFTQLRALRKGYQSGYLSTESPIKGLEILKSNIVKTIVEKLIKAYKSQEVKLHLSVTTTNENNDLIRTEISQDKVLSDFIEKLDKIDIKNKKNLEILNKNKQLNVLTFFSDLDSFLDCNRKQIFNTKGKRRLVYLNHRSFIILINKEIKRKLTSAQIAR